MAVPSIRRVSPDKRPGWLVLSDYWMNTEKQKICCLDNLPVCLSPNCAGFHGLETALMVANEKGAVITDIIDARFNTFCIC